MKRYRDKMKTDTDKYEQMKKKGNKKNVKIKEKKNDIAMLKEMRRQKRDKKRRYRAKKSPKTKQKNKKQNKKLRSKNIELFDSNGCP